WPSRPRSRRRRRRLAARRDSGPRACAHRAIGSGLVPPSRDSDQIMANARGTVLIVDDDPVSVEVLGDYLARKQLGVVRAHTVDQALAELDSERPEVAVVGVRLGDTGELEAIKRIREANVHVTLLATATPEDGHLATAALGLGATDYL